MSIIAEALKKAQKRSLQRIEGAGKPEKQSTPQRPEVKTAVNKKRLLSILTAIAFLLAGTLLFYFSRRNLKEEARAVLEDQKGESSYVGAPIKEEEIIPSPLPAEAPIVKASITSGEVNKAVKLEGIMYTHKRPLAVINNSVWSEGESVGRFKVVEIGKSFIKVASDGQEFVIKLKR